VWSEDGGLVHQQGPLRFEVKGLLWPLGKDPSAPGAGGCPPVRGPHRPL
jgi:hypothetical protein